MLTESDHRRASDPAAVSGGRWIFDRSPRHLWPSQHRSLYLDWRKRQSYPGFRVICNRFIALPLQQVSEEIILARPQTAYLNSQPPLPRQVGEKDTPPSLTRILCVRRERAREGGPRIAESRRDCLNKCKQKTSRLSEHSYPDLSAELCWRGTLPYPRFVYQQGHRDACWWLAWLISR